MKVNLFEGLEQLGLETSGIELYKKKEEQKIDPKVEKEIKIKNSLYDKTIECPVCYTRSKVKTVRPSALRIVERDTDFMTYYEDINPLLYGVSMCNECGYAGIGTYFKNIRGTRKEVFIKQVSKQWKKMNIPEINSVDFAIKQHKLALLSAVIKEAKASEKALICLRLSWLYRLNKDTENEKAFQKEALTGFVEADLTEDFPIAGLSEYSMRYLLGELNRRLGNNNEALRYFLEVIVSKAPDKLRDQARDQRDLIKKPRYS